MALDMPCQEMYEAWQLGDAYQEACCHCMECSSSHRGSGRDSKGEFCGERKQYVEKEVWQVFVD